MRLNNIRFLMAPVLLTAFMANDQAVALTNLLIGPNAWMVRGALLHEYGIVHIFTK